MKKLTRILSVFLALALCIQMLPARSSAKESESAANPEHSTIETDNVNEASEGCPGTTVQGELTDKRTEKGKHFRMDDGSFIAVDYGEAVHYSTDGGETWEDIDNTLLLSGKSLTEASVAGADAVEAKENLYWAKNGDVARGFSPDLSTGLLFSASNGNYGLRMGLVDNSDSREAGSNVLADADAGAVGSNYNASATAEISYPDAKTRGNDELSIAEQVTPTKLRTDVLYRDVYDGVDLSYELYGYNVKETILVNRPRDGYSFSFILALDGLSPELTQDGSIELRDADGVVVYLIPAPYMTDAADAFSGAVSYDIRNSASGAWTLTVTADAEWINADEREFPVAIDPTIIDKITWSSQGIGVTYVVQGQPSVTHTHYQNIYLGYTPYQNMKEHQIYVGWDTLPTIPAGSEVVNAQLYLGQCNFQHVGPTSILAEMHEVTDTRPNGYSTNYDWICGLNWNSKPNVSSNVLDYTTITDDTTGTYIFWDMTGLVKTWYLSGNTQTRAAGIKLSNIGAYGSSYYATALFHGYGSGSGPLFVVSYRNMTGIEPYYSYQALGADRAGSAYISDYTGALTTVTPLVSFASTVNPFTLNLVYNSSYFTDSSANYTVPHRLGLGMYMGSGVCLDVIQKMEKVSLQYEVNSTTTKTYFKYTDGDGTVHYFEYDEEKDAEEPNTSQYRYYYDEDGLGLKAYEYSTNNFRMEDDHGNQWTFVNKFLTTVCDANNNAIEIHYVRGDGNAATWYPSGSGDKIEKIVQQNNGESAITVATFTYGDYAGNSNYLRGITDYAGNAYSFLYLNSKLTSVKRNNENYIHFVMAKDGSGILLNPVTGIEDKVSKYGLYFEYENGRVSQYYEKGNGTVGSGATINRAPGKKATYRDWGNDRTANTTDDILTTYLFDYAGRTVNAYSADSSGRLLGASNAVYSGTGNTDKKNNRTLRSAGIGMAGMNLIQNGSFEAASGSSAWTPVIPEGSSCNAVVKTGELTRTGEKAFKTWVDASATGPTGASRSLGILNAGASYTFSVYVNTSRSRSFGTKGIYLKVLDSWGAYWLSEYLNYKTEATIDGGWVKLSFSFTAAHSAYHSVYICDEGVSGIVYYDDFQMEAGVTPTNVNLLENGGIESSSTGWLTETDSAASVASVTAIQGGKALKIIGSPTADKYLYQTVTVNQPSTQTYVLSGWAQANAVPDNVTTAEGDDRLDRDTNKQFGLRAVLNYTDNSKEYHYVPFNAHVTDWQFASLTIVPKAAAKTVATIEVVCAYEKNANTAYFDNLSLVKEAAQTMRYDADGNLVSVQSTGTKEEESTYQNGNLTQIKTGGSGTFDYTYDNKHNLSEATNGTVKETYSYDAHGNLSSSALTKATGTPTESEKIKSSRSYTNSGNLLATVKGANGCYTSYYYSSALSKMLGLATKTTNPKETSVVTNYDDNGRVASSWISSYISVYRTYNDTGLLTMLDRGGYNKTGNDSTKYHQYYNFTYDDFGNTAGISVGDTTEYDLGAYTYGAHDGLLTGMTYGNGATVNYTYDDLGRKTQTATSSGDTYTYNYTGDGQLYQMQDSTGGLLYRYNYDTIGRLIGSSMKAGSTVTLQTQHQYDEANRLSRQIWALPGKTYQESFVYDEDNGRLTHKNVKLPTNETANIALGYDDLSRVSTVTTPAATSTFAYAGALYGGGTTGLVSELTTTSVHTGSSAFTPLHLRYTYDALGNIRSETRLNPDNTTAENTVYTYDNQSQLTQAVSTLNGTWNYQYDTYGNIRHQDHGSNAINYTYGDSNWRDLLTSVSGTKNGIGFTGSYVYDGAGNPTSFYNVGDLSAWTMTWKNGRELATASNGTHSVSYDYDVNGLRTCKIVDGIRHDYVYASGQLLRETFTQSGTDYVLDFLYDQGGRPYVLYLTTTTAGTTVSRPLYYILNLQGDVIYLVNTAGVAEASYAYDPYGSILSSGGSLANVNPLRYRGYYYDAESGFYYLQSRNYDPSLGRFINADTYSSTGQGFLGYNMFAYCCNRVISTSDQTGEFFFTAIAIGFGIGLAAQYIGDVVENVQSGETGLDILVPHSSIKDYAGSGIGCAIAAIPGFGFWGTVGLGALGNVTSDLIKGNLKDGGDVIESAVKGGLANAVGYAFQKGIEFLKVKQISNMPRTERKLFLKTNVYQNSQAFVNSNLRTFANATVSENMSIVSKTLTIFKSGIYSTLVSGILGKIIESK